MKYLLILFLLTACSEPCKVAEIGKCDKTGDLVGWDEAERCSVKCEDGRGKYLINPMLGASYD